MQHLTIWMKATASTWNSGCSLLSAAQFHRLGSVESCTAALPFSGCPHSSRNPFAEACDFRGPQQLCAFCGGLWIIRLLGDLPSRSIDYLGTPWVFLLNAFDGLWKVRIVCPGEPADSCGCSLRRGLRQRLMRLQRMIVVASSRRRLVD